VNRKLWLCRSRLINLNALIIWVFKFIIRLRTYNVYGFCTWSEISALNNDGSYIILILVSQHTLLHFKEYEFAQKIVWSAVCFIIEFTIPSIVYFLFTKNIRKPRQLSTYIEVIFRIEAKYFSYYQAPANYATNFNT
jgi:hypothetical protein